MAHLPPELLVLRHAKSSHGAGAASDFERPLAPRGRRDAARVGRWLAARGLVPDRAVASPALRTRQTLELALEALGGPACEVEWEERLYEADLATLLGVIEAHGAARRLLLVGHNPGLEALVAHLAGGAAAPPEGRKRFPTAALACFRAGALVELARPRDAD